MKKLITLLLALSLVLAFTACSSEADSSVADAASSVAATSEVATSEAATSEAATSEATEEEYYSQDLTITNSTGFEIYELYITPSTQEDFGTDLLGDSIFEVDGVLEFTTDAVGTADATWDIRAVDGEGNAVDFYGANFSASTTLDINMGEDGATPTITMG